MEKPPGTRNPAASFTDDILIEILSRLPVRSVCRFKCVSRSWLNLISDPYYREKLPQTLAGFFYSSLHNKDHHFTSITENGTLFIDPSFPYLPVSSSSDLQLLDSCDGLLLCFYFLRGPPNSDGILSFHYAVCNPATEKWVMLPDVMVPDGEESYARLCFDRTVSRHFHVILHVVDCLGYLNRLQIYSSKTGSWNSVESGWHGDAHFFDPPRSVFLNGFLHENMYSEILTVDMEGKTWRTIPAPIKDEYGFIHQAQGHLSYICVDDDSFKLSVWTLDDYATNEWILKHTVSTLLLFGGKRMRVVRDYQVIGIHPEGNMIFFIFGEKETLMAYIMDRREVRVICNLGDDYYKSCLPYVPLFLESAVDRP